MRWALYALGVVILLVVGVVAVGAFLPRDHVASLTARIGATPDSVWAALTDPSSFPSWRSDVKRVEQVPGERPWASWKEYSGNDAITLAVEQADRPKRLVTRITDKNLPFGGWWEYRIEPDGASASKVTITEHGSVYNPLFRFVSRFIMGHTATIDSYLRALGRKFGSEPTPERVPVPAS